LHCLNLRWAWHHPTIELFRTLDPDPWEETGHNPRLALGRIEQKRLVELSDDEAFLAQMDRASADLDEYVASVGWYHNYGKRQDANAHFPPQGSAPDVLLDAHGGDPPVRHKQQPGDGEDGKNWQIRFFL
jgi:starch phosphorylase